MISLDRGDGSHRDHLSVFVADPEFFQVFDLVAKPGVRLHDDLPRPAEPVEVVHIARAEKGLHRSEHVPQRNALRQAFVPIDVDEELWLVGLVDREQPRQFGPLVPLGNQVVGLRLQRLEPDVAAVFHHDLETAHATQSGDGRRHENVD